ncbi:lytic transglycosylase domain-containing protein [Salmonella enterica]|nr:lytic transglycosylase domain-containing protein [Salmonella enterica]
MLSAATFVSLAMQCAVSVHPDTALDVAKTESGFNPYAIAEIIPKKERGKDGKSVITHMPKSKSRAIEIINGIEQKKRRYSVGLMQITSTNFSLFNVTAEDMLDPCSNLKVFEKIISDCYKGGGDLRSALSCYYSGDYQRGKRKESEFNNTSYIQRIGYTTASNQYVVPSTKEDRNAAKENPQPQYTAPPTYESWDVLREFPRTSNPKVQHSKPSPDNKELIDESSKNPA